MVSRASRKSTAAHRSSSDNNDAAPPTAAHPDPKVFILPTPTPDANLTILTLPHPATQAPTRYLLNSSTGLHEIKKLSYPASTPRSWLATPSSSSSSSTTTTTLATATEQSSPHGSGSESGLGSGWLSNGQILPASALYLCTPLDPLFLLLPHLLATATKRFLPLDDILDPLLSQNFHWNKLLLPPGNQTEKLIHARIKAVCDSVDAGGQLSYRLSQDKLLHVLAKKCLRIAKHGFPSSLEEEFVKKVLAKPIGAEIRTPSEEDKTKEKTTTLETPITTTTTTTTTSSSSSLPPPPIIHLHNLSLSLSLLTSYLPPALPTLLQAHLSTLHDPAPLTTYLSTLTALKSDLSFTRAGDYSLNPRGGAIGDEFVDSKHKRKRAEEEEEKKRKKNISGGVRKLGKVDTKGMAKMTSFFKKTYE
ncbi:ribonuclease H2, subunit B [Terfezia claveryi]|nr:ribonuclease H2, subunit B [Terfezia claveryi]